MLISWANVLLPLHHNLSWDSRRNPKLHSETAATWALWMVRLHIGIPYFYGGLAKLVPDWMLGEPMRTMLLTKTDTPLIGDLIGLPLAGLLFSWGGILLDLSIVPLLMIRKTRLVAYAICVLFHLTNAVLFQIHIFPWFMIVATTIFFEPDWPRRFLGVSPATVPKPNLSLAWTSLSRTRKVCVVLLSLNGRKPQLLIDPSVDLVKQAPGQRVRSWVLPTIEPLRKEPWNVPLLEWEQTLELPPLEFLRANPIQMSVN